MKKIRSTHKFFIIAFACLFAVACADAPKKDKNQEEKTEEVAEPAEEAVETMEEDVSFVLPSPIQIAAIFSRSGLKYESGLTNPISNTSKYNTKTAKYLNFGVFSADLAYVVLNSQQQESIDYLNTVRVLSDEIGMPSIFGSGQLIESFEKNISNQDTVLRLLTTIKRRTDEYLAENAEESKEAVFFSAAWLEGMYIGANSTSDKTKITPRIIEQMTILNNIIKALKVQNDASLDIAFLTEGLEDLSATFEGFKEVKSLENPDMDISDITLTDDELTTLTTKITALRTKVING